MTTAIQKNLIYIIAAAIILIIGLIYFFSQNGLKTKNKKMEALEEQKLIESVTAPKEIEPPKKTLKDLTAPKLYKAHAQNITDSLTAPTQ